LLHPPNCGRFCIRVITCQLQLEPQHQDPGIISRKDKEPAIAGHYRVFPVFGCLKLAYKHGRHKKRVRIELRIASREELVREAARWVQQHVAS